MRFVRRSKSPEARKAAQLEGLRRAHDDALRALDDLPRYAAFTLKLHEAAGLGLTDAEIAEALSVPVDGVEQMRREGEALHRRTQQSG